MRSKVLLSCLIALAGATFVRGEWPVRFRALESTHFCLYYPAARENDARRFLAAMERIRPLAVKLTGHDAPRAHVVLEDWGLYANGLTDPVFGRIRLGLRPPSFAPGEGIADWPAEVSLHETVHLFHLTRTGGVARQLVAIFGDLLLPNLYGPEWLTEGLAVAGESMLSPVQGRLADGLFAATLAAARGGGSFLGPTAVAATPLAFPADMSYLYGGSFVEYLARRGGEGVLTRWIAAMGKTPAGILSPLIPALGIDASARRVFGRSLASLWREWQAERSAKSPVAATFRPPGRAGWWPGPMVTLGGDLVYAESWPQKTGPSRVRWHHRLVALDPAGRRRTLRWLSTAVLRLTATGGKLYYVVPERRGGFANLSEGGTGIAGEMRELDPTTGRERRLGVDLVRALAADGKGGLLLGRDLAGGGCEILALDPVSGRETKLWSGPGLVDELLPRGGTLLVLAHREGEPWGLQEIVPGREGWRPLLTGGLPRGHLAPAGASVLFTQADGEGYRIERFDPVRGARDRLDSPLTVCRPVLDAGEAIVWLMALADDGWHPWSLPARWVPVAGEERADEPAPSTGAGTITARRRVPFSPSGLIPRVRLPFAVWRDGRRAIGALLMGADPPGFLSYAAEAGWDTRQRCADLYLTLSSAALAPLTLEAWGEHTAWDRRWGVEASMPLRRRLGAGWQSLELTVGAAFRTYPRRVDELVPRLIARWGWPGVSLDSELRGRIEWRRGGAVGTYLFLNGEVALPAGAFSLRLAAADDPSYPSREMLPPVRVLSRGSSAGRAVTVQTDLRLPVLRVRRGSWNPFFYLEDLWAGVFYDRQERRGEPGFWSTGGQLTLETKVLFSLPLAVGARVWTQTDRRWRLGAFLELSEFPFLRGGGRRRAASP